MPQLTDRGYPHGGGRGKSKSNKVPRSIYGYPLKDHQHRRLGKAGRSRWMGKRPLTRGVAKNPVDHPHGGGEGRTSGGRHPVTPWGKPTKGKRTRSNKSTDKYILRSRHAKKKGR